MSDVANGEIVQAEDYRAKYPQMYAMIQAMSVEAELNASDPQASGDFTYQVMENILASDGDADTLFNMQDSGTTATRDYLDSPFRLQRDSVRWMRTAIEGSPFPFYAVFTVTDLESGEDVALNGGGSTFCAILWKLLNSTNYFEEFGEEGPAFVLKGKPTLSSRTVITLRPWKSAGKKPAAKRAASAEK